MPADEKRDTHLITLRIYELAKSRAQRVKYLTRSTKETQLLYATHFLSRPQIVRYLTRTTKETQLLYAILFTKSSSEKKNLFFLQFELFLLHKHFTNANVWPFFFPLVLDLLLLCKPAVTWIALILVNSLIVPTAKLEHLSFKFIACSKERNGQSGWKISPGLVCGTITYNNNNLLICSGQVSTIRFSNACYKE